MARKLAAGNWKMNGCSADLAEIDALVAAYPSPSVEILICPPATLLARMSDRKGALATGGQDCHADASGAHTGDVSAAMLKDAGASHVILGHSERRQDHGESDRLVREKVLAATGAGLMAVVCIGESEAQRDAGETLAVIGAQLAGSLPDTTSGSNTVVAYEPIWAIGTGRVPTLEQIAEVHDFIRAGLADRFGTQTADQIPLLYGGSVKPANAADIFATANVDGALVGGASLKAQDFSAIIDALENAG